jgi:hypothetical protein
LTGVVCGEAAGLVGVVAGCVVVFAFLVIGKDCAAAGFWLICKALI